MRPCKREEGTLVLSFMTFFLCSVDAFGSDSDIGSFHVIGRPHAAEGGNHDGEAY